MIGRVWSLLRQFLDSVVWGAILVILSRFPAPPPKSKVRKRRWIDRILEAGALFGTLAVLGGVIVLAGLIPIKASSGHWPVTRWFLEFSMERGFSMQSRGVTVPRLDDRAMVLRGATQFEATCRPCHGAPDLRHPRVAAAMTPQPPYLPEVVPNWDAAELFTIVKHGVKFTGMPAWPANHRDDEVWDMVAFLRILPGLDADEYRALASGRTSGAAGVAAPIEMLTGPENLPRAVRERCARCHGVDGRGRGAAFPILAGQHREYLYLSLEAFERGDRHSGVMEPVAAGLSDREMQELARYYAELPPAIGTHGMGGGGGTATESEGGPSGHAQAGGDGHAHTHDGGESSGSNASGGNDGGKGSSQKGMNVAPTAAEPPTPAEAKSGSIARGRHIAHRGIASAKVPACAECHGPTEPHPRDEYPMLAGQHAHYIVLQLELFKKNHRGGTPFSHLMNEVAPKLSTQQMRDVAAYYESLRP